MQAQSLAGEEALALAKGGHRLSPPLRCCPLHVAVPLRMTTLSSGLEAQLEAQLSRIARHQGNQESSLQAAGCDVEETTLVLSYIPESSDSSAPGAGGQHLTEFG